MFELGKRGLRCAVQSGAFSRFVSVLERFDDRRSNLLRVLMYHRVDNPDSRPGLYPPLLSATPDGFARQMEFLAARYRVIGLEQLLDVVRGKGVLPPRSVLLTFDDAYRDFVEHAWPVLSRHNLPVTLFVPTAFPDHPDRAFWWDRLHACLMQMNGRVRLETTLGPLPIATAKEQRQTRRQLVRHVKSLPHHAAVNFVREITDQCPAGESSGCVLGWEELRQLASDGVTLAPHTQTHPLLNRVSIEEARSEVLGSLQDLQRSVGPVPAVLAYPAGGFNDAVGAMLQREGFELAFTTIRGVNDLDDADVFRLRRIPMGLGTTEAAMRVQLMPWWARFRQWRN